MLGLRQRALLDLLGIPVWISRKRDTQAAAKSATTSIWRDLTHIEPAPVDAFETPSPVVTPTVPAERVMLSEPAVQARVTEPAQVPVNTAQTLTPVQAPAVVLSKAPAIKFHLQVFETAQWLVMVNADELQHPQADLLWRNIQLAFKQPTVYRFSWPLAEGQRWQTSQGAKAALNGFLFRLGLDKRAGLIGDLPDEVCPDRLERLPRLAELLQEPLKKRQLWQVLKTSNT